MSTSIEKENSISIIDEIESGISDSYVICKMLSFIEDFLRTCDVSHPVISGRFIKYLFGRNRPDDASIFLQIDDIDIVLSEEDLKKVSDFISDSDLLNEFNLKYSRNVFKKDFRIQGRNQYC